MKIVPLLITVLITLAVSAYCIVIVSAYDSYLEISEEISENPPEKDGQWYTYDGLQFPSQIEVRLYEKMSLFSKHGPWIETIGFLPGLFLFALSSGIVGRNLSLMYDVLFRNRKIKAEKLWFSYLFAGLLATVVVVLFLYLPTALVRDHSTVRLGVLCIASIAAGLKPKEIFDYVVEHATKIFQNQN